MKYPVNEIFTTIQGEANFTGTPSLFIRTQGCDVGCPWCDTKHTWSHDDANLIETVTEKTEDTEHFAYYTTRELVEIAQESGVSHVVLTGGEPAMHNLREVTDALAGAGFSVQIETSGTYKLDVNPDAWVTLSPKENMPGGRSVLDSVVARANEVKYPVGKRRDIENAKRYKTDRGRHVWLQPLSQNEKATRLCVSAAKTEGFKVSVQTHKYIGVS